MSFFISDLNVAFAISSNRTTRRNPQKPDNSGHCRASITDISPSPRQDFPRQHHLSPISSCPFVLFAPSWFLLSPSRRNFRKSPTSSTPAQSTAVKLSHPVDVDKTPRHDFRTGVLSTRAENANHICSPHVAIAESPAACRTKTPSHWNPLPQNHPPWPQSHFPLQSPIRNIGERPRRRIRPSLRNIEVSHG